MAHDDGSAASLIGLDRHGDVTWLADPATGALSDSKVYDPFGEVAAVTGVSGITVGFQGDYTDPASGEVWMGARWYDPTGGQFRSRDTVFGELMTPVSLNRYTYGWANPLTYWDPDGRFVTSGPLIDGVFGSRAALDKQIAADVRAKGVRQAQVQRQAQERRIRRISEEGFGAPTPRPISSSESGDARELVGGSFLENLPSKGKEGFEVRELLGPTMTSHVEDHLMW